MRTSAQFWAQLLLFATFCLCIEQNYLFSDPFLHILSSLEEDQRIEARSDYWSCSRSYRCWAVLCVDEVNWAMAIQTTSLERWILSHNKPDCGSVWLQPSPQTGMTAVSALCCCEISWFFKSPNLQRKGKWIRKMSNQKRKNSRRLISWALLCPSCFAQHFLHLSVEGNETNGLSPLKDGRKKKEKANANRTKRKSSWKSSKSNRNYLSERLLILLLCFQSLSIIMSTSKWDIGSVTSHKTPGNGSFLIESLSTFSWFRFRLLNSQNNLSLILYSILHGDKGK